MAVSNSSRPTVISIIRHLPRVASMDGQPARGGALPHPDGQHIPSVSDMSTRQPSVPLAPWCTAAGSRGAARR